MPKRQLLLGAGGAVVAGGSAYDAKVLTYSPLAFFPLNEESGDISDISGNGYTATVTGASWLYNVTGIGDGYGAMDAQNNGSHYFTFDATLPADFDEDLGTFMMWMNYENAGDYNSDGNVLIYAQNTSTLIVQRLADGSNFQYSHGSDNIAHDPGALTGWRHIAITWNFSLGDIRLYYEGTEEASLLTGIDDLTTSVLQLGGAGLRVPNGPIAKLVFFDSELSSSDISDLATL
jgi:hypothetical protein